MKAYIAGPYRARTDLQRCADELRYVGFTVTARWLDGDHEGAPDAAVGEALADRQRWAAEDLLDVAAADVLVAFTSQAAWDLSFVTGDGGTVPAGYGASGGRHVETGYALALGKHVVLVGEPENVFHSRLTSCEDWHDAVVHLAAMLVERVGDRMVPA